MAPLFYNLAIIISIFFFRNSLGIVGLGVGAAIGAVLQLLVALLGMWGTKFRYQTMIAWENAAFRGSDVGFITLGTKLTAISMVTFGVYIAISAIFSIEESRAVTRRIKRLILAPVRINW